MKKFVIGDAVVGTIWLQSQRVNRSFCGKVTMSYGDDSYRVDCEWSDNILIELYDQDTMEHATKLHKFLAGDDNV